MYTPLSNRFYIYQNNLVVIMHIHTTKTHYGLLNSN